MEIHWQLFEFNSYVKKLTVLNLKLKLPTIFKASFKL